MISAALFAGLLLATFSPLRASQPDVRSVPSDKIGDVSSLDDLARPSADTLLHLTFAVNSSADVNAASFVNSLTDPKSPNYHKWLTPKQFGEKFGATDSDIAKVTQYLSANRFSGIKIWSNKLFVSGAVSRITAEKLFGVTIHGYDRSAQSVAQGFSPTYYAADSSPTLPATVADAVKGVFGLSNVAQRQPSVVRRSSAASPLIAADGSLLPADLSSIYNEDALHQDGLEGTGITIALFSPTTYAATDVATFFKDENIPTPDINIVEVNGGATDNAAEGEACLDIETIIGQAPDVVLNVYEGPNDGSLDIYNQMAEDDPDVVSESYGAFEDQVDAAYAQSYETLRETMAAEGISIFVSSGDFAAYDNQGSTVKSVTVDASSAYVTAVGGTELTNLTAADTWNGEVAWSFNDAGSQDFGADLGSNGGLSIFYAEPSWQSGPGVTNSNSNGMRQVPDIAALAGAPNYDIYDDGAFAPVEGTSGSCPLWASSIALIEEGVGTRLGNIDPSLYNYGTNNPTVYHDITSGNNGAYFCTPGWDFVTGWGSANFGSLLTAFQDNTVITAPGTNAIHVFSPGLQMISAPYAYDNTTITATQALSGLVTAGGLPAFDVAQWQPTADSYNVISTSPLETGFAYWARFAPTVGGSLNQAGSLISALTFGVPIAPGWNMVGDPYGIAIPITNAGLAVTYGSSNVPYTSAVSTGLIGPTFYDFNGTDYVPHSLNDNLESYDGYWLYSTINGELVFQVPGN